MGKAPGCLLLMAVATVTVGDGSGLHYKNKVAVFDDDPVGHISLLFTTVMNGFESNDHVGGWGGKCGGGERESGLGFGLMLHSDGTACFDLL